MSIKFITVPTKRLSATIDGSATSFIPSDILGWDGNALTSADLSSRAWAVFRNSANTLMEIMEIDPSTIASSSVSIITRGLKFDGNISTSVSGNKLTWIKGDTLIDFGTSVPQLLSQLVNTTDAQTINGVKTFSSSPIVPTGGTGTQAANNQDIANAITGASGTATNSLFGTVKLSVAAVSTANPIAVGDNDTRVPPINTSTMTAGQVQAMAGTSGTPSSSNKYVTNADTTGTGSILRSSVAPTNQLTMTAGATITSGQPLHLSPFIQTDGGITFDANSFQVSGGSTLSHTIGNFTNRVLLVTIAATSVSAVTYGGVAMTLVTSKTDGTPNVLYSYKLVAPAVGTANISVTGTSIKSITGTSYYNVDQSAPVDASASGTNTASTATATVTTVSQGSLVHSSYFYSGSGGGTFAETSFLVGSSYKKDNAVVNSSYTTASNYGINSGNTGKINDTTNASVVILATNTGGGSVNTTVIALALKPATAVSAGVVPTNSSAIGFNEPLINFIGFASASAALGASVAIQDLGNVGGLSLTAGYRYYLKDTPGTIGTTPGTYGKVIGKAIDSATLFIQPEKTLGTPIAKVAGYNYGVECDGFLTAQTSGTSATANISANGIANILSPQVGVTANFSTPGIMPVYRGSGYSFSSGQNLYFIPLA